MQNLRILRVNVVDSTHIEVTFTANLTSNLTTSNVSIISDTTNVPNSEVSKVSIIGATLKIVCLPLHPYAQYYLEFVSTSTNPFISVNGEDIILEDGVANKYAILGPLPTDDIFKDYLTRYLSDNIYNISDNTTIVSKYLQSLSINLSKILHDIGLVKNENYLSVLVQDERKIRGQGPFDRLDEEGAYQLLRLGRAASNTVVSQSFSFDPFPSYPITLQKITTQESLTVDSSDEIGKFNINTFILNLENNPVVKVTSIIFNQATAVPVYTYDIETLGYQLLDSRYDQDYASTYLLLENNQVKLNNKILEDPDFTPTSITRIDVIYEYKNLGRVINESTVSVYTVLDSTREEIPPIINVFTLKHAPVVDSSNEIPTLGGVTFTDPNNTIPGSIHPAFMYEIPYSLSALPYSAGQYSVDYTTGNVYVYGEDSNSTGTGAYPPLITYKYRLTYQSQIDYVYDSSLLEVVALPYGSLVDYTGTIEFEYEDVFVPNVDYKSALHQEALSERADNRLVALNVVKTENTPITNVFRVYNETSGEIYTINRWTDDKIYFVYQNPPRINNQIDERVSFNVVANEMLFVNEELTNSGGLRIFKINLDNNTIISASEDSIASSFNTSLIFTETNIFSIEKWYNRSVSAALNINNLDAVGQYTVNYASGIIYCAVSNTQKYEIGFATYKNNEIIPTYPHLISVDDVFYRIDALSAKGTHFSYNSFDDGQIIPGIPNPSDELYLNNSSSAPYQLYSGEVGIFSNSSFSSGVTYPIKYIRALYEYRDCVYSKYPLNFSSSCSSSGYDITVSPLVKQSYDVVQYDGSNYYVIINENIPYLSSNITYEFSVIRISDSIELWNGAGTIVPGNPLTLILSGVGTPSSGDVVNITATFTIKDLSRLVIDYNKGELYIDYTYLADELILSYEYGDNVIDFRTSNAISEGEEYYVTYRAGALRDALYRNFGNLINVPELTNFDIDFDRERYRDALTAALSSFIQGPTVNAIKNIGKTISHIEPELIESVFQGWSLGNSLLNPESITTDGTFQLLPAKFGNGVLVDSSGQIIKFPINSNIKLESGTFETWMNPQWNGLDNDANLTFRILQDGYAIDASKVFIGASEEHPTIENGIFTISKAARVIGAPNKNKDGVFIYYDLDSSGSFYRWFVEILDGYVAATSSNYRIRISSDGTFYDVKSISDPKPSNLSIASGNNVVNFIVTGGSFGMDIGITFVSDLLHYILDFGESALKNRISLFKDASGYLSFKVIDNNKVPFIVSYDVSSWVAGDLHHVAISWKLNTINSRDEMHLFIDGFEIPNIIRYGQKLQPYLHEKYRTVNPEEVLGLSSRDIISSIDLVTTLGSNEVSSLTNFSSYQIFAGDRIFIDEVGFNESGYGILSVVGQTLLLDTVMPATLTNGRFSVNRTEYTVTSDIDIAPNIQVITISSLLYGNDLTGTSGTDILTSVSTDFESEGILPGYSIQIGDITSPITYVILEVSGNTLTINDDLPSTLTGSEFNIYPTNSETELPGVRAVYPDYSISKDGYYNNILTISNGVFAKDLILVRTLGLNHQRIKKQYYCWSDGYENILMTKLPAPISLDEVDITKIILPRIALGPSNCIIFGGAFLSPALNDGYGLTQPTETIIGRTISATISGTNIDFTGVALVAIAGTSNGTSVTEILSFSDYGTLDFTNLYTHIDYIAALVTPIDVAKNAMALEVREKYPITYSEFDGYLDGYAPIIRYSYPIGNGYTLYSISSNTVGDGYARFSDLDNNNYLQICRIQHTPADPSDGYLTSLLSGFYKITGVSEDKRVLTIQYPGSLPAFTGGVYRILNVNLYRSGLQNGFFTFENDGYPGSQWMISRGFYELDYSSYARIKLNLPHSYAYLGTDFDGNNPANAIIDQVKIYSSMLTDTRVGEQISASQRSITKDYNSLKPLEKDSSTLMLINFDTTPFTNDADFYINSYTDMQRFHSIDKVNENFADSLIIWNDSIILSNDGIIDSKKEGTIELWTSPLYDTGNDPNVRFYLDATSAVVEEAVSINSTSVKISASIGTVLSVTLKNGNPNIDYFAGGRLEIDTQRAISESQTSISNNKVIVNKPILQVISVKIKGDITETDYFAEGSIGSNNRTIYLGKLLPASGLNVTVTYQSLENNNVKLNTQVIRLNKQLPSNKCHVLVNYIPKGMYGDRIALYKDIFGYVNFVVTADGTDYVVRGPTRWIRDTWHKIKASYRINSGSGTDDINLFLDGYRYNDITFSPSILFGEYPEVFGGVRVGDGYGSIGNIRFRDPINTVYIGSEYTKESPLFGIINNLRISNVFRPIYAPYNEPLDVSYSSNLSIVYPVTRDLYTTYLLDSDVESVKNEDFSTIINRQTGTFDFLINIFDSFGIVSSSIKVKEALEKLINILKPANSKSYIQYIE